MQFTLCSFRLLETHKWDSNCKQLVLFPDAWKYKHACSMWSKRGWIWLSVESRRAFSPLLSGASVSSVTVLSNKPAPPTGRVSCLKAPLPNNTVTLKRKRKKRILRLHCFSLCYHLSIRSLFCAQLANLIECLSFNSQSGKSDLIRIAVLSAGATTNEALFF